MRWLVVLLALVLSGCATGKALTAVCSSCELLHAAALCPASNLRGKPVCPEGQVAYIINVDDWLNHLAEPIIECRFK